MDALRDSHTVLPIFRSFPAVFPSFTAHIEKNELYAVRVEWKCSYLLQKNKKRSSHSSKKLSYLVFHFCFLYSYNNFLLVTHSPSLITHYYLLLCGHECSIWSCGQILPSSLLTTSLSDLFTVSSADRTPILSYIPLVSFTDRTPTLSHVKFSH